MHEYLHIEFDYTIELMFLIVLNSQINFLVANVFYYNLNQFFLNKSND